MNGWDWVKAIVSGDGGVVQDSVNSDGESGNGEFDGAVMEIGLFRVRRIMSKWKNATYRNGTLVVNRRKIQTEKDCWRKLKEGLSIAKKLQRK